jgi:hypothetical protein
MTRHRWSSVEPPPFVVVVVLPPLLVLSLPPLPPLPPLLPPVLPPLPLPSLPPAPRLAATAGSLNEMSMWRPSEGVLSDVAVTALSTSSDTAPMKS